MSLRAIRDRRDRQGARLLVQFSGADRNRPGIARVGVADRTIANTFHYRSGSGRAGRAMVADPHITSRYRALRRLPGVKWVSDTHLTDGAAPASLEAILGIHLPETMSVVSDRGVEPAALSLLLRRPTAATSIGLDLGFAVVAYFVSYWLRFRGSQLAAFFPGAVSTLPFVVGGQILVLLAVRAYARRQRIDWLVTIVAGSVIGTLLASVLVALTVGFAGVSRSAVAADAVLFTTAALGWRGAWVVRTRGRGRRAAIARLKDAELVDRAAEMTPLAAVVASLYRYRELLKNLILKDL